MWDKLKGKSKEEKVEATRLEIQKMTDKCVADFKKGVVHELGKLGIKEPSMTLTGYPTILVPSFIIAKFDDNESRPVISIQFLELYMGTPSGTWGTIKKVYPSVAVFVSTVPGAIPFTLVHREISKGFLKGSQKLFVPFTNTNFGDLKLSDQSLMQHPLVLSLNQKSDIFGIISSNFLTSGSVWLTHKAQLNLGYNDLGGRCTIIPFGDETVIFLRDVKGDLGAYFNFRHQLYALSQIRTCVSQNTKNDKVSGNVPALLFNTLYSLSKSGSAPTQQAIRLLRIRTPLPA
jgi:hypothetical protein